MLSQEEKSQILNKLAHTKLESKNLNMVLTVYNYYKQCGGTKKWIPLSPLNTVNILNTDIETIKLATLDLYNAKIMAVEEVQIFEPVRKKYGYSPIRNKLICRLASYEA